MIKGYLLRDNINLWVHLLFFWLINTYLTYLHIKFRETKNFHLNNLRCHLTIYYRYSFAFISKRSNFPVFCWFSLSPTQEIAILGILVIFLMAVTRYLTTETWGRKHLMLLMVWGESPVIAEKARKRVRGCFVCDVRSRVWWMHSFWLRLSPRFNLL